MPKVHGPCPHNCFHPEHMKADLEATATPNPKDGGGDAPFDINKRQHEVPDGWTPKQWREALVHGAGIVARIRAWRDMGLCSTCEGSGGPIRTSTPRSDGTFERKEGSCPSCNGTGKWIEPERAATATPSLSEKREVAAHGPGGREEIEGIHRTLDELIVRGAELRDAPLRFLATLDARAEEIAALKAEVEMLRGVGCMEDGDGPCGACLKCARAENARLREALRLCLASLKDVQQYGLVHTVEPRKTAMDLAKSALAEWVK